ncbi:S-adenosyl-L-methionine-dependent methyltransferase [Peziza echinospora]|nr:S-adenosyl-L-methionine-dependent methyltransferase [Peziza echinospora]
MTGGHITTLAPPQHEPRLPRWLNTALPVPPAYETTPAASSPATKGNEASVTTSPLAIALPQSPRMSSPESTLSLDPEIANTIELYGRTYQECSIDKYIYCVPVDEAEHERLLLQHRTLQSVFEGRLIFPPVNNPKKILDCGCGSAAWATEVAERFPESEVIGIDLSPHMAPDPTPYNFWFQIDDLNKPFTFQEGDFDLVHSRFVSPGIELARWKTYARDCFRVLKSDGWLQMVEFYYNVQSDNGSLTDDHALRRWSEMYLRAHDETRDLRAPLRFQHMFEQAGFVDVETKMIPIHLNGWSNNPQDRAIGEAFKEVFYCTLSALGLHPLIDTLGMSLNDAQILIANARHELESLSYRPYLGLYCCIGRKS